MKAGANVHIVILHQETDQWCEQCQDLTMLTVIYLTEHDDHLPSGLHRLSYCENCQER